MLKQRDLIVGAPPRYLNREFDPDDRTNVSGSDGGPRAGPGVQLEVLSEPRNSG